MIRILLLQQCYAVTGAKDIDLSLPKDYDFPKFDAFNQPSTIPINQPTFQFAPTPPLFEVKIYDASMNHMHAGVDLNMNPNLTVGVNAVVTKNGDVPYYGLNGRYTW